MFARDGNMFVRAQKRCNVVSGGFAHDDFGRFFDEKRFDFFAKRAFIDDILFDFTAKRTEITDI